MTTNSVGQERVTLHILRESTDTGCTFRHVGILVYCCSACQHVYLYAVGIWACLLVYTSLYSLRSGMHANMHACVSVYTITYMYAQSHVRHPRPMHTSRSDRKWSVHIRNAGLLCSRHVLGVGYQSCALVAVRMYENISYCYEYTCNLHEYFLTIYIFENRRVTSVQ